MPERSFGRTIRYRRTKMGLSQAKLGELVGRSSSTVRSWERDNSVPSDKAVLDALAAVLAIDSRMLYGKAGFEAPETGENPTVEQALASLQPEQSDTGSDPTDEISVEEEDEQSSVHGPDGEGQLLEAAARHMSSESQRLMHSPPTPPPGYVAPRDPLIYMAPSPRVVEPSYVEDADQLQTYRIRNLATVVLIVALIVVLVWAGSNAWDAFSTWWDDFFGQLRL